MIYFIRGPIALEIVSWPIFKIDWNLISPNDKRQETRLNWQNFKRVVPPVFEYFFCLKVFLDFQVWMCTHKINSPDDEICAGIPRNSVTSKRLFSAEKKLLFSSLFAKTLSYLETRPIDHLFINFLLRRNKNVWENMKNNSSKLTFRSNFTSKVWKKKLKASQRFFKNSIDVILRYKCSR